MSFLERSCLCLIRILLKVNLIHYTRSLKYNTPVEYLFYYKKFILSFYFIGEVTSGSVWTIRYYLQKDISYHIINFTPNLHK